MGAYVSVHNDTSDETVMVFVGVNTKVLQPLLWSITGVATAMSGGVALGSLPATVSLTVAGEMTLAVSVSTLTAAAGGLVSASNFILDQLQTKLVNDLTKGGYHKCLPGQTYTTPKLSPALNLRAWLVRIQRTPEAIIIKRCSASVWTGGKPGSQSVYRVLDKHTFPKWTKHETIPIKYQHMPEEVGSTSMMSTASGDSGFGLVNSKRKEEETFTLLDSGMAGVKCKVVESNQEENGEDDEDAWIQVDAVSE